MSSPHFVNDDEVPYPCPVCSAPVEVLRLGDLVPVVCVWHRPECPAA